MIAVAVLLTQCLLLIPNGKAGASSWLGFAGVFPGNAPTTNLTGEQVYRYDSIPSNIAGGAGNCTTLLGAQGDGTNQPYVYQNLILAFTYGAQFYDYFGTIHQCAGYEWWLFWQEYDSSSGPMYTVLGDQSITGSNEHHFYEFINNSSSTDVMAAQVDGTIKWTSPQHGVLGTSVSSETLSTSQEAVTTYQGSQLNYNNDFTGWTSFDMSSSDTFNNGGTNLNGTPAMCAYVVSPPSSLTANFGQNTSNTNNCT